MKGTMNVMRKEKGMLVRFGTYRKGRKWAQDGSIKWKLIRVLIGIWISGVRVNDEKEEMFQG